MDPREQTLYVGDAPEFGGGPLHRLPTVFVSSSSCELIIGCLGPPQAQH